MDLVFIAEETLAILELGSFVAPSGAVISLDAQVADAIPRTHLRRERELDARACAHVAGPAIARTVEVTDERSGACARRLAHSGAARIGVLNFANAVTPGGGFLGGARAQEEQLCRCSSLYRSLTADLDDVRAYYAENDAAASALVLDHVLVSPDVVFFRDEDFTLLEAPCAVTVLTCAAPDLNWLHASTDAGVEPAANAGRVSEVLRRRALAIVAAAAAEELDTLVLGAWGCGAFRNDPDVVAAAFADALTRFADRFSTVVFACFGPEKNRAAFARRFSSAPRSLV